MRARRGRGRSRHRCHGVFLISVGTNATTRATPAPACAGDAPHNIRSAMGMSSSANWLRSSMGISRLMPFLERMPGSFRSFSNSSLLCQNIPTCEAVDLPCPIAGSSGNFSPRVLRRREGGFQYRGPGRGRAGRARSLARVLVPIQLSKKRIVPPAAHHGTGAVHGLAEPGWPAAVVRLGRLASRDGQRDGITPLRSPVVHLCSSRPLWHEHAVCHLVFVPELAVDELRVALQLIH